MFEQEKNQIIDNFLKDVKDIIEMINMLRINLGIEDKAISSSKDQERLEAEIEGLIAFYNQKELNLSSNLIALYKKYNKPHPLKLEEIIENKEAALKKLIDEATRETKRIDDKIFEVRGISPLVHQEFFKWVFSLNYEALKKRYQELAKDPSKIDSSYHQNKIVKALRQVVKTF